MFCHDLQRIIDLEFVETRTPVVVPTELANSIQAVVPAPTSHNTPSPPPIMISSTSRIAYRIGSAARRSNSALAPHRPVATLSTLPRSNISAAVEQHQLQQRRAKSSLPLPTEDDDDDNHHVSLSPPHPASPIGIFLGRQQQQQQHEHDDAPHLDNNTSVSVSDYTSDSTKAGTPSPWAVFDAWGAGDGIADALTSAEEAMLSPEMVRIPTTDDDRSGLPDETNILECYDKLLKRKSSVHFGYPYNLMYNHEELYEFMKYSINNLGDPFVASNYGVHSRQFECAVIDFFADLWKMEKDSYWGYVTTCGTEGNLHGILLARECHPDGILYSSRETHYSIFKAARYYRMDAKAIPTLPMGEIDYDALAMEISKNRDRPVIINVNIGTTVKGAVDNLDRILRILKNLNIPRERYHIHCDGALFAMMMPFVDWAPEVSFQKPIDSIAVSGHKMLGCPMPCGIALTRKEHVKKVEQRIDYLNSVDTTIMGSRNGQAALYLWYSLRKKGIAGIKRDVV